MNSCTLLLGTEKYSEGRNTGYTKKIQSILVVPHETRLAQKGQNALIAQMNARTGGLPGSLIVLWMIQCDGGTPSTSK